MPLPQRTLELLRAYWRTAAPRPRFGMPRDRAVTLFFASAPGLLAAAFAPRSEPTVIATLGRYDGVIAPSSDGRFGLVAANETARPRIEVASGAITRVARGQFADLVLSGAGNRIA